MASLSGSRSRSEKPDEKVLMPQSALIVDQQGIYVFLVVDGKAAIQRVKLGGESARTRSSTMA